MTVQNYAAKVGPSGMKLVEVSSVEDARAWLRLNDTGGQGHAAA